jgi:hypothetical protein
MARMSTPTPGAQVSEDGHYWWDGTRWQLVAPAEHGAAHGGHAEGTHDGQGAAAVPIDWGQYPTLQAIVASASLDELLTRLGISSDEVKDALKQWGETSWHSSEKGDEFYQHLDRALADLHSQTGGNPEAIGGDAVRWLLDGICIPDGIQDTFAIASVNMPKEHAAYARFNEAYERLVNEQVAFFHIASA